MNIASSFKALISLGIASAVVLMLFDSSRFRDRIKLLCGIMMLALIIQLLSPLTEEINKLVNIFPSEDKEDATPSDDMYESEENVIKESARQMASYIKMLLCGRYEISEDEINVSVLLEENDGSIDVKSITVSITENHMQKATSVSEYVSSLMGCKCTVIEL